MVKCIFEIWQLMDFLENFTRKFRYNCLQFPKYHTKECGEKTNFNFTSGASFLLELVGPFPSSLLPPFQNESLWKISYMKMSLICMKVDVRVKTSSCEWFCTKTWFHSEAMAYSKIPKPFSWTLNIFNLFIAEIVNDLPPLSWTL